MPADVLGGDRLSRHLDELGRKLGKAKEVRAGFPEGSKERDGTPMALIAAVNNFGAPAKGIPPRPFFSEAVEKGRSKWGPQLGAQLRAADMDSKVALERMGAVMAGDIGLSLIATDGPPLSPVTLLLRQRFPTRDGMTVGDVWQAFRDIASGAVPANTATGAKPLVWSGQMLAHLQGPQAYEVVE